MGFSGAPSEALIHDPNHCRVQAEPLSESESAMLYCVKVRHLYTAQIQKKNKCAIWTHSIGSDHTALDYPTCSYPSIILLLEDSAGAVLSLLSSCPFRHFPIHAFANYFYTAGTVLNAPLCSLILHKNETTIAIHNSRERPG